MRYKVGDIVQIINSGYNSDIPYTFTEEMGEKFGGKTAKIIRIEHFSYQPSDFPKYKGDGCRYYIDIDPHSYYWWSNTMFIGKTTINILEL